MEDNLLAVLKLLPDSVSPGLLKLISDHPDCTEIRLRSDRQISLTLLTGNFPTNLRISSDDLQNTVTALCGGSLHAHGDTIANGYIVFRDGFRIGVSGRAVTENDRVTAVYDYTSLNIRIPKKIYGISARISEHIRASGYADSLLIYSPPGAGKTTVLRDLVLTLSRPPHLKRVALIDTRSEIANADVRACDQVDLYDGYPKAVGMELAVRTMAPEYVVCDEIGSFEEAKSILSAQNAGVPIIATAHAGRLSELLTRPSIRILHEAYAFDCYVGIKRVGSKMNFSFTSKEEIS